MGKGTKKNTEKNATRCTVKKGIPFGKSTTFLLIYFTGKIWISRALISIKPCFKRMLRKVASAFPVCKQLLVVLSFVVSYDAIVN